MGYNSVAVIVGLSSFV